MRSFGRQSPHESATLDLTASESAPDGEQLEQARAFYRDHAEEVVARMRTPSSPTSNPAAVIVAQCTSDGRLRAEALGAIDDARRARDARATLDMAMGSYGFGPRSATVAAESS